MLLKKFFNLQRFATIKNSTSWNTLISGTSGDDIISNKGYDEYIYNVSIDGGNGNDSIDNNYWAKNSVLIGGAGNDSITNSGDGAIIDGGADNDYIKNEGANVSILSGTGDDYIKNTANKILFVYSGGNDTIEGIKTNSTLKLATGTLNPSVESNGTDLILSVGENKILLKGAHSLNDSINIVGANDEKLEYGIKFMVGTDGDDTLSNNIHNVSIIGGEGNNHIANSGQNVSIVVGAGNDTIENWHGDNTTIVSGDGNDSIDNYEASQVTISGGAGNDSIYNREGTGYGSGYANDVSINGGAGDDYISSQNGDRITINGGTGDDYISLVYGGNIVQYADGDGNDTISGFDTWNELNISGNSYSTALSGDDVIVNVGVGSITLKNAADLFSIQINGEEVPIFFWTLNGTTATYTNGVKNAITVSGVKSTDGLSFDGSTLKISNASLNKEQVTINGSVWLELDSDVTLSTPTAAEWSLNGNVASYKSAAQTEGYDYSHLGSIVDYFEGTPAEVLFTVTGVKSVDGLSVNGTTVTVSEASLNDENITISDGYTLKLAKGISKTADKKGWTLDKNTATYTQTATAGYSLAEDKKSITYTKAADETLATVKGVKSIDGLKLKNNVVTVSEASLNEEKVTVSDGYTLKLGSDVSKSTSKKGWTLNKSTELIKIRLRRVILLMRIKNLSLITKRRTKL